MQCMGPASKLRGSESAGIKPEEGEKFFALGPGGHDPCGTCLPYHQDCSDIFLFSVINRQVNSLLGMNASHQLN